MSEAPETLVLRAIVQLDERIDALGRDVAAGAETLGRLESAVAAVAEAQARQGRVLAELLARRDLVARALDEMKETTR